jgi:putative tryptophan/tyrosine transport system substrate-binding protein
VRRRDVMTLLGGAAAAWPLAVRGQQGERMRCIGVLMGFAESDPEWQARLAAMLTVLPALGWTDGRNVRIDYRWAVGDSDRLRGYPKELIALAPDVLFACPHYAIMALYEQTRTIPIVGIQSGDFVAAGFAQSHARPGGNVTGFTVFEATISTKFLQLLKDIAPQTARVCVMQAQGSAWRGDFGAIDAVTQSFGVEAVGAIVRDSNDIERTIVEFAGQPNGGLIFPPDAVTIRHRELIIALAAKHRLPAVYSGREFLAAGGLLSYATDQRDIFRRAASYVDRILRGAKPADLPVQAPVKFELVINLKTAKALGLDVPLTLLARADEVIE